jgi:electron transfer flavoprotein alpha subunit
MGLGLCADCTALEADGDNLVMYRPALSGSLIAKIVSKTRPAMATVRTVGQSSDILVSAGWGAKDSLGAVQVFVEALQAEMVTSRKMVDNGILPYAMQVGLTGKTVNPAVYIAVGISGAVHHIAGMQRAGTVIAINPDREAPIFEYADYGILDAFSAESYKITQGNK